MSSGKSKLALVMSGGGARGAYEAGVIQYIRTQLPPQIAHKRGFDILCGTSVGAINACFIASTAHNLPYQGRQIAALWSALQQEQIYRRGMGGLTQLLGRSFLGILKNLLRSSKSKPSAESLVTRNPRLAFNGFLDTTPLNQFLRQHISWKQIAINIQQGLPLALSVTATNVHTGKMELFIARNSAAHYFGRHHANFVDMEPRHVMASSAIPLLFPSVKSGNYYYCDGSLRLNTPMSPAIHLGADKVLVIGVHHMAERSEQKTIESTPAVTGIPTLGQVLGKVLTSIFLDRLEYDLEQMKRINRLLDLSEKVSPPGFLGRLNDQVRAETEEGKVAPTFRKLSVMKVFPSRDIRNIFSECISDYNMELKAAEKFLFKLLDIDWRSGRDFLSFVLFIPQYLKKLVELGFEDARSKHDELVAFFVDP